MKIEDYFNKFNSEDFPIFSITPSYELALYENLQKTIPKSTRSNCAIELVTAAHPSIWTCHIQGHISPMQAWYTPEYLYKTIENRMRYLPNKELTAYDIVRGFSISKIAPKVSLFRPATAKYLINKYLSSYNTIFDPCSGFSGRMLGACALGKKYIGQDCNYTTISEAKQLIARLNLSANVTCKNSIYDKGSYDCLFTCPPYMNKQGRMTEIWNEEIEPLSEDEWITTCINNYDCNAYLFVVANTELYKQFIVETISNKSHFGNRVEYVIYFDRQKLREVI